MWVKMKYLILITFFIGCAETHTQNIDRYIVKEYDTVQKDDVSLGEFICKRLVNLLWNSTVSKIGRCVSLTNIH